MRGKQDAIAIELVSGCPQFRIKESKDVSAPTYTYYGQPEVENDLVGLEIKSAEKKQIRTFDEVNTVNQDDLLFSLISGKATLARGNRQGYLFTQNYVKFITKGNIDQKYLVYLLNENANIKQQFQMGLQGSAVLKYSIKQLKELKLPELPAMEKQKLIGELYFNQLKLQALRERVAKLETTIMFEKLKEVKTNE